MILEKSIFKQLEEIGDTLRAFSLKLTHNESDARDLYQDTALLIMSNADKYRLGTNFKAWAMTIMKNRFINNYRKKVRSRALFESKPNHYFIDTVRKSTECKAEAHLAYQELRKLVEQLPEDFKRPFWMAFEGYPYKEIANLLEAPVGTVKSRIFLARRKLQKMYCREYGRSGAIC